MAPDPRARPTLRYRSRGTRGAAAVLTPLARLGEWLGERPVRVLAPLIAAQIAATALLASRIPHNGAVWYQGGDQLWHSTYAAMIGRLVLPPADVGFGWGTIVAPLTWFTGPTFVRAMPGIIALQVLILAPVALLCVYGIARELAGRWFGYWTAFLWVAAPYACIPLFVDRYHEKWVEQFLPQALGLTALADLPSLVALLVSAYLVVRSLATRSILQAVLGGVVLGFAGDMKPSNLLFAVGPALAYTVARHWRVGLAYAAGTAPGLVALVVWKQRGLGDQPILNAAGGAPFAFGTAAPPEKSWFEEYVPLDFGHLWQQVNFLHEFFRVPYVAEVTPVVGFCALLLLRKVPIALLVGGWLASFTIVKGTSSVVDIQTGSFFRLLMPAWPAYLLLFAAAPLVFFRRAWWARNVPAGDQARPRLQTGRLAAAVALGLVPLVVAVALRPTETWRHALLVESPTTSVLTPVDRGIDLQVTRRGGVNELVWSTPDYAADVVYRVYRARPTEAGFRCEHRGVDRCTLDMVVLRRTREHRLVDGQSFPAMTYRIGVAAHYADPRALGDVFALSPAVSAPG